MTMTEQLRKQVKELFKKFRQTSKIGTFDVRYLGVKRNYYDESHEDFHTYPAIHHVIEISGGGIKRGIRVGIQIVDAQEKLYHLKEVLGQEVHKRAYDKTEQISRSRKPYKKHYKPILKEIFTTPELGIHF